MNYFLQIKILKLKIDIFFYFHNISGAKIWFYEIKEKLQKQNGKNIGKRIEKNRKNRKKIENENKIEKNQEKKMKITTKS